MANAPFPVVPELTAIAVAYKNSAYIADSVMPRVMVGKQDFKYLRYNLAEGFTIPDTKVGRSSQPNKVTFSATDATDSTQDYGLEDPIPQDDIDNAPPNYDPRGRAVEGITDLVLLDREKRVADLLFNAGNYAAANKLTLAGVAQWSDFTNSHPLSDILTAIDAMVMRPNVIVMGRAVWTKLSTHPEIVSAILGNPGTKGIVRREQVASLFELQDVLVGESWVNSAAKGQAVSLSRIWGKSAALIYRDQLATNRGRVTFGFTAQWGNRVAGSLTDPDIGLRGGERVRVGESVKELLTANDLGYLFSAAVA